MAKSSKSLEDLPYDKLKIIEVIWIDAQEVGGIGWNDLDEILTESLKPCPIMHSVGIVLRDCEDCVSLLSTVGPSECSSMEKIPRVWIKRETVLRDGISLAEFMENL